MHQGEIADVACAGDVDIGGAHYKYAQDSNHIIAPYTDTKYTFEITECAKIPISFREDHGFGALDGVILEEGRDFYIQSQIKDSHGHVMIIEVDANDKYAPRKTGVYNVHLQERVMGKQSQMWNYDKLDATIHSVSHAKEDTVLLMGNNDNMVSYKNK